MISQPNSEFSTVRKTVAAELVEAKARYNRGCRHWKCLRILRLAEPTPDYSMYRQELDSRRQESLVAFSELKTAQRQRHPAETTPNEPPTVDLGAFVLEMDGVELKPLPGPVSKRRNSRRLPEPEAVPQSPLRWSVRRGERWGIFTDHDASLARMTSILAAESPDLSSMPLRFFGRRVGPRSDDPEAITVEALRQRVGYVSPEMYDSFPRSLSIRQSLESAWADTFLGTAMMNYERDVQVNTILRWFQSHLHRPGSGVFEGEKHESGEDVPSGKVGRKRLPRGGQQELRVRDLISTDLDWADETRFGDVSLEAQAAVLFLRVVLKKPDILVLREPFRHMGQALHSKCERFLVGSADPLKANSGQRVLKGQQWRLDALRVLSTLLLEPRQSVIYLVPTPNESTQFTTDWMLLPGMRWSWPPLEGVPRENRPLFTWFYGPLRRFNGSPLPGSAVEDDYVKNWQKVTKRPLYYFYA